MMREGLTGGYMMRFSTFSLIAMASIMSSHVYASHASYCISQGGTAEEMIAEFDTHAGLVEGFNKSFCTFQKNGGFIAIGLETFSSTKPNIAATLIKTLPRIEKDSPLFKGKFSNPSANVCQNLGGSMIGFNMMGGGFSNALGQSDVCVFGDGSMVSSWSLIYMANGREGYDTVKNAVHSQPMSISIG